MEKNYETLDDLFKMIEKFNQIPEFDLKDFRKKLIVTEYIGKVAQNPQNTKKKIANELGMSADTINKYAKSLGISDVVKIRKKTKKKSDKSGKNKTKINNNKKTVVGGSKTVETSESETDEEDVKQSEINLKNIKKNEPVKRTDSNISQYVKLVEKSSK